MATTLMRVRTIWTGVGGGALSTHYWGPWTGAGSPTDIQACVDRTKNFWAACRTYIGASASYTVSGAIDLIQDTDGALVGSLSASGASNVGADSNSPLPAQTQGLVAWSTGTIVDSHRLRGQTYIPAPSVSVIASGAPTSVYLTALNAGVTAILATGTYGLLIWHRPKFDSAGTLIRPGASGPVTGGAARGKWAVLRSRR